METLLLEFEAAYAHVVSPSVGSAVFTGQNNAVYGEIGPKSLYHLCAIRFPSLPVLLRAVAFSRPMLPS